MEKSNRRLKRGSPGRSILCNVLAAMFSIAIVFPLMFMILDREVPLSMHYLPLEPSDVIGGETYKVRWIAELKRTGCDGTLVRRITDSAGFVSETKPMPIETFERLQGRAKGLFSNNLIMPQQLTPGPGTYQIITTYWCNPIQKYLWPIVSKEQVVHFFALPSKEKQ